MENHKKHKHLKPLLAALAISLIALGSSLASSGGVFQGALRVDGDPGIGVFAPPHQVPDLIHIGGSDSSSDPLMVASYIVRGAGDTFEVSKMEFNFEGTNEDAVDSVILRYPTSLDDITNYDGESRAVLVSGKASFTGLDMVVPNNRVGSRVELYVTTNEVHAGADSGDIVSFSYDYDGEFEAVGTDSGETITPDLGNYLTTADIESNEVALYRDVPVFATDTSASGCPSALLSAGSSKAVYCFSVSTDGPIGLYKVLLSVTPQNLLTGKNAGELGELNGWDIYDLDDISTSLGSGKYGSNRVAITFNNEEEVNNTTKYYVVKAPVSYDPVRAAAASIDVNIPKDKLSTSHAAGTNAASVTGSVVWSDQSAAAHSLTTNDWYNSYAMTGLPTERLALEE